MKMKIRNKKPEANNLFYITKSKGGFSLCIEGKPTDECNVLSNCVGYACGRFNEIIGNMKYPYLNCNAENFIERAEKWGLKISNVPTVGGIMVWQKGNTLSGKDGAGHVAIVEKIIDENTIYTSESSYGSLAFFNSTRKNTNNNWGMKSPYKFRGCIINPSVEIDEPEKPIEPEKPNNEFILNLVKRTIRGDYGNGNQRKLRLGKYYKEVQRQVNLNYMHKTTRWDSVKLY